MGNSVNMKVLAAPLSLLHGSVWSFLVLYTSDDIEVRIVVMKTLQMKTLQFSELAIHGHTLERL